MQPSVQLEPSDVEVRVGLADDVSFIVRTWSSSHRKIYPNIYALDRSEKMTAMIHAALSRATVLVAHLERCPDIILSYLVHRMVGRLLVVDFAYTDEGARRRGIVTRLLAMANPNGAPVVFTQAPSNENVMRRIVKKYVFDPSMS